MGDAMRIVVYTEGPPFSGDSVERGPLGGAESAFIYLARELALLGHSVLAFCRCPFPGSFDQAEYRDLSLFGQWASAESCDLFICSRFFHIFREAFNAKVNVLWNHDFLGPDWAASLAPLSNRIDYAYALSAYHELRLRECIPARVPLRITSNGVDFEVVKAVREGAVKQHRILFTSRPERGLMEALQIYEELGDPTLELVACTYPLQGNEAAETEALAEIERLRARGFPVRTASFAKRELYQEIARSKAVIYPTCSAESFCISAIESQACGTVFLTTAGSAMDETVGYHRVHPGDRDGFVRLLRAVLSDEELRRRLERIGLDHVRRFSWRYVARQFVDDARAFLDSEIPQTVNTARPPAVLRDAAPPISCLTVTLNRLPLLDRAMDCYCRQTYPNRELVIVTDAEPRCRDAIARRIRALDRSDIRLEWLDGGRRTLGALRNVSLERMTGDVLCQWDDDDLYHPERIARQFDHLAGSRAGASFLTDQLQFHFGERCLRWIDWTHDGVLTGKWKLIPGTLMMWRDARFRYPESGDESRWGEDSALLDGLLAGGVETAALSGAGYLYVYVYHGANMFSEEHHQAHRSASWRFLEHRLISLREALESYALPMPYRFEAPGGEHVFVINK